MRKKKEVRKGKGKEDGWRQMTVQEIVNRIEGKKCRSSTGKYEPEAGKDRVETRKKTQDIFPQKLDGIGGSKAAMFGEGGQDPKEGTILLLGGRAKTTFGGQNVFHDPSEEETPGRNFGKKKDEETRSYPMPTLGLPVLNRALLDKVIS